MWSSTQIIKTKLIGIMNLSNGITYQQEKLKCLQGGMINEDHSGLTTLSTVRESITVQKGSQVINLRQLTITSVGEFKAVAQDMDIPEITQEDLISNVHLEGLPELSKIPTGSYVQFIDPKTNQQRQLVLFVTGINDPCHIPAERISERLGNDSGKGFQKYAMNRRGLIAIVYRAGEARLNDNVKIITPKFWAPE